MLCLARGEQLAPVKYTDVEEVVDDATLYVLKVEPRVAARFAERAPIVVEVERRTLDPARVFVGVVTDLTDVTVSWRSEGR
jgi:hypothetical protein